MAACRNHCEADADIDFGPLPVMWKTIGDEVLFVKEVTDHRQIIMAIRCWMTAVVEMRQFIKKDNPRLDVKCTAWLAGFPFRNSEVVVSNNPDDQDVTGGEWFVKTGKILNRLYAKGQEADVKIDYIGPSIDIGFRLGGFCSARKFVVSVDIAYVLSIANPGDETDDPVFKVYFDGPKPLKGVLGGVEYPVFWLDLSPLNSLDRAQDKIAKLDSINRDRLREYCNIFFSTYDQYVNPPFIHDQSEQQIKIRPPWYDKEHKKLIASFISGEGKLEDEEKSIGEKDLTVYGQEPELSQVSDFLKKLSNLFSENKGE